MSNWIYQALPDTQFKSFFVPAGLEISFNLFNSFQNQPDLEDQFFLYLVWMLSQDDPKYFFSDRRLFELMKSELQKPYFDQPLTQNGIYFTKLHYYFWLFNKSWMEGAFPIHNSIHARYYFLDWYYSIPSQFKNFEYFQDEYLKIWEIDLYSHSDSMISVPFLFTIYWNRIDHEGTREYLSPTISIESQLRLVGYYFFNTQLVPKKITKEMIHFLNTQFVFKGLKMRIITAISIIMSTYQFKSDKISESELNEFLRWFKNEGIQQFVVQDEIKEIVFSDNFILHEDIRTSCDFTLSSGVNIIGYPRAEFGLGEDCRTTYTAIHNLQSNVFCFSLENQLKDQPLKDIKIAEAISQKIQFDMNIYNTTLINIAGSFYENYQELGKAKYNIGYPPWEFDEWKKEYNFCFNFLDEIWCISQFNYKAFSKATNKPVFHMPLAVELDLSNVLGREYFKLSKDHYLFYFMFDFNSSLERKNPLAVIRAFKKSFANNKNVQLVIKTMYPKSNHNEWQELLAEIENDPQFIIISDVLTRNEMVSLMNCCDCFVSLHRSEGFGRGIAEAMLLEKPVIATGYSGNLDFCSEQTSQLVSYELIPVKEGTYRYAQGLYWADPSVDHASELMMNAYRNNSDIKMKIQNAKKLIEDDFSIAACGRRYLKRIQEIRELTLNRL